MDFNFREEQIMLREMAKKFFEKECPKSFVKEILEGEKGYSESMWQKMAELGWMGLIMDERYDGVGGSFLDLSIILEETGRALLPAPFFATVVLGAMLIQDYARDDIKERYLPAISHGEAIATLALTGEAGSYSPEGIGFKGEHKGAALKISGSALFVPYAHVCDAILCPVAIKDLSSRARITLMVLDTDQVKFDVTPMKSISGEKICEVALKGHEASTEQVIGEIGKGWDYIEVAWPKIVTAKCSEMIGGIQQVLEMTIKYVNERRQFGRPLAAFQAIQHMCADMAISMEASKYITYQAAWMISEGLSCQKEAAMAKAWCSEAFKEATKISHQAHGAIGFTEEHDLHLFTKHAKSLELTFGDGDFHKEVVARCLGL